MREDLARKQFWLGALALVAVAVVIHRAALDVGFWTDDYTFFQIAGRLGLADYLRYYFDPFLNIVGYRPLQGMMWGLDYLLFGQNEMGYHLLQVIAHAANIVLLYGLVVRITRRVRLGFLVALVYLTLPLYALAVYWPSVADPLAALFFLLALWFWIDYLTGGRRLSYALTLLAVIGGLLTKEVNVMLPFILVLAEWWLVPTIGGGPAGQGRVSGWPWMVALFRRYAAFFALLPIYALLEYAVISKGTFTQNLGYGLGSHIAEAFAFQLGRLAFPWGLEAPWNYLALLAVLVAFALALRRRMTAALFVGITSVLLVLPVLPFPIGVAEAPRYMYLPLFGSAVAYGVILDAVGSWLQARARVFAIAVAVAATVLATWGGMAIGEQTINFAGTARQVRLQFRPIYQKHTAFESNTLLYFINPPMDTPLIYGLMFQHYGAKVDVYGSDREGRANLGSRRSYIYYFDENQVLREQPADSKPPASDVRVRFAEPFSFEGWELANAAVKPGEPVILLVYWRAAQPLARDYTMFTHLVNARGEMVAGYDGPPRYGKAPTSRWRAGQLISDGIVIPIDASIAPGEYQIELGWYDPTTLQRLTVLDANGNPGDDKIMIGPIRVGE